MLHNPLRLPPWRFGDKVPQTVAVFNYEAYSWAGRPLTSSRVPEVPAFWFPAQAAKTLRQSEDDYLASYRAVVVPDRCRPAPGRLVRRPRAVLYVGPDRPFAGANNPFLGFAAGAQSLASGLEKVGAWAGMIGCFGELTAFVPPRALKEHIDFIPPLGGEDPPDPPVLDPEQESGDNGDDIPDVGGVEVISYTPVLEPDKVVGGECLFIRCDIFDSVRPFGSVDEPPTLYTNFVAATGAFARALSPRFERFAYHVIVSENVFQGVGLERARSFYQQAIDACGAGYSLTFTPAYMGLAEFVPVVQSETVSKIKSFFGL